MKWKKIVAALLGAAVMTTCFAGCGGSQSASKDSSGSGSDDNKLVIYCPHPLSFINPLVEEFEKESGIKVEVVAAGTGELLKRVESEKANPLGDIFWGGSLSTMKPKADLFEPYKSVNEDHIQAAFKNTEGSMTRFTDIPSVIMVNTDLIGDIKVEGYEDLLNPALKGKIAMADPSKSSSAYEHLINMLSAMGNGNPDNGWDYVTKFCKNLDGKLLSGSSAVYKGVADGEYVVGCTFEEGGAKYVSPRDHIDLGHAHLDDQCSGRSCEQATCRGCGNKRAVLAAMVRRSVLGQEHSCAGVLASSAKALDAAQCKQQQRRGDTNGLERRQAADKERCSGHAENRDGQRPLPALFVAHGAPERSAKRTENERESEDCESHKGGVHG